MKKIALFACFFAGWLLLTGTVFGQGDIKKHPSCPLCGMDRKQYAHSRMVVAYAEGLVRGTCSLHCTASEMTVNRDKTLRNVQAADYNSKRLIPAEKAFWVIGGNKVGVMTRRAKWAFGDKQGALAFIRQNGGQLGDFQQAMQATFVDMYEDIKIIRERRQKRQMEFPDLATFPECKYCGMIRKKYAHSRAFIEYNGGSAKAVGTCSVHCLAIDMALNTDKTPKTILVGDYNSKKLIDAEKAFWVLGGDQVGVMSIRGKWAFEEPAGAEGFIRSHGGQLATFDEVMKTTFEDMFEILR
jgi:copper chaperone NosL